MPLSSELGARGRSASWPSPRDTPELRAIAPLLALQAQLSALPDAGPPAGRDGCTRRDGCHLFLFPFAGRLVHEGLAALLALRWGRLRRNTFTFAVNDYGLALSPAQARHRWTTPSCAALLTPDALLEDLRESLNLGELARRQFRDIARVAGLLPPVVAGPRAAFDAPAAGVQRAAVRRAARSYDPDHLLLAQAEREVFAAPARGATAARHAGGLRRPHAGPARRRAALTPLSFPLWAESVRGQPQHRGLEHARAPRRRSSWRNAWWLSRHGPRRPAHRRRDGAAATPIARCTGRAAAAAASPTCTWARATCSARAGIALPRGGTAHDLRGSTRCSRPRGARGCWCSATCCTARHRRRVAHAHGGSGATAPRRVARRGGRGNHDRALARADLGIELLGEACDDGAVRAAPCARGRDPRGHVLCGHLHPVLTLPGMRRRWPAFWLRAGAARCCRRSPPSPAERLSRRVPARRWPSACRDS